MKSDADPRILILGMGNPILSDDGVGLVIAERLKMRLPGVDVEACPTIGLTILDLILGYDLIFVIDAMTSRGGMPGTITKLCEHHAGGTLHLFSSHGVNFYELMTLGERMGYAMPEVGGIYGIEIGDAVIFGEQISPGLQERLDEIVNEILADMHANIQALAVLPQSQYG